MYRKFITLIASTAIAVTGLTAPARADSQDLARALVAIGALALIGKAIHDSNDAPAVTQYPNTNYGYQPHYQPNNQPYYQPNRPYPARPYPVRPVQPRPIPPQISKFDLPAQCLRSFDINRKTVRLLGSTCLRNNYRYSGSLPYACQFSYSTREGSHTGYEPLCLRQRGYRVAG